MRKAIFFMVTGVLLAVLAGTAGAQTQINIATVVNPDFVHTRSAVWFKECVEQALPGKYAVNVHHSAALGSETQVLQQIQLGTTQMSVCTTAPIEAFVPEIKALEMPFVLPSYEAADKVLDGEVGAELGKKFEKAGFIAVAFLDNGFRNVTNSKRPVKSPADLKDLKIRTMEAPTHLAIWRAIGANPTPMAWPIFTQLQQGVIDGQENPIAVIHMAKMPEAGQKYLTLTRHVYSALVFVANKAFIDGLPAEDRQIVMDCARKAALRGRQFIRDNEARQLAELQAAGMEVEAHPDLAAFRKATAPVIESASGDTKKLVEMIQQTVK
ncbi:MAG: DctP family TRAP transporter solute-binding subunit [Desulfobacteraceae bacterium]|jgi:tripartite ATP-independent transporter DctP family solute receptor|nr:DctP family TRAP transporter solute-binding subunit [Desulfobacteraceae bacterium]